ncbi:MAG: thioredoxin domain-containing protein [Pseudomonadota bacterium]|nr:thioredoxin domain-containing protein [Pseudomonadota bacterium]
MSALRSIGLWLLVPLMLFGIFVGGLMTWHHDTQLYGGEEQQGALIGCTESAEVNCDIVNTSAYSEIAGIPIATLSIPFYATVLVLAILALRRRIGARALIVTAGAGALVYSGFLYYISTSELKYVCAWCIRLYGVNAAIVVLGLFGGKLARPDKNLLVTIGGIYIGLLLLAAGGERLYRASLTGSGGTVIADAADERERDPKGDAPTLSFTVKTEDNNERTYALDADDAWTGNRDAKVAVVMFGDLECGYCKRSSAEIGRLEATYGDRVLFVYKHFPMDPACNPGVKNKKHREACLAAKASVCAQEQGVFWAFHDLAYKNQHQLGADYLRTYAVQAGSDGGAYDACMSTDAPLAKVRHDAEVGASLDVHGTPRIFVNGKLYRSGSSAEVMARAIEVALGASEAEAAKSAATLRTTGSAAEIVPADSPAQRDITFGDLKFKIDTFEGSIKAGAAVSAKHEVPALRVTWYDAKAACEKAGKRLCTEEEWVSACQNSRAIDDNGNGELADDMIEGTAYPYGDFHDDNRCWDARNADKDRPVYTGELAGCATPTGVYDLTGNVEEWAGDTPEKAVLLGGAYDTSEDHARCYRRNDTFGAGYASPKTGFRCCGN